MSESNPIDWPASLPVPHIERRYQNLPRSEVVQMEGARIRSRRNHDASLYLIDVKWTFTQDQYDTFRTFFDDTLFNGEDPFIIDLDSPSTEVVFLGGYSFTKADNQFTVSSSLEVIE